MTLTAIFAGGPQDGHREVIEEQFGKPPRELLVASPVQVEFTTEPPSPYPELPREGRYELIDVSEIPLQQTAATTDVLALYDWRGWR